MADNQPKDVTLETDGGAPTRVDDLMAETRQGPTWKAREDRMENLEASRSLGNKYGSWMIVMRKPRNYQNKGESRKNIGRNTGEKR